jgi:hypothetical protein
MSEGSCSPGAYCSQTDVGGGLSPAPREACQFQDAGRAALETVRQAQEEGRRGLAANTGAEMSSIPTPVISTLGDAPLLLPEPAQIIAVP